MAYKAIDVELDIGALLPCNVVLQQEDGQTAVHAVDPSRRCRRLTMRLSNRL